MIETSNELQVFPRQLSEQALLTSALCVVTELSRVSQGDSRENRAGDKIIGQGIDVKLLLYNNAATPVGVRVILIDVIADKYIAVGDDFTNNGSSDGPFVTEVPEDLVAPLALRGKNVLFDQVYTLPGLGDATSPEYAMCYISKKFKHYRNFEIGDLTTSDQSITHNLRLVMVARFLDADATAATIEWTMGSEYFFREQ